MCMSPGQGGIGIPRSARNDTPSPVSRLPSPSPCPRLPSPYSLLPAVIGTTSPNFLPSIITASSRTPSLRYTANSAEPEPVIRQTRGWVRARASKALPDLGVMTEDGRFEVIPGQPADVAPTGEAVVVKRDGAPAPCIMVRRIDPAIGLGGRDAHLGYQEHGRRRGKWRQSQHSLTASPGQRELATGDEERHVATELGRELQQLVPGNRVSRELIHGEQGGGTVARAAAQPGLDRNPFGRG